MRNILRRFISAFKEYIILVCLLFIALTVLSINNSAEVKNVRRIALGNFAVFSSIVDWSKNIFVNESEMIEQKRLNAELMLEVNKLREYALENLHLKKMLDFKKTSGPSLKTGRVISKFVSNIQGLYVLNLGSDDSISVGMPVITEKGLAGIIVEVSNSFSLIRNLKNNSLKLAVSVQRSNVDGIMKYDGENLIIENIPSTFDLREGDRVVTSDYSTIFPPSIPVGILTDWRPDISGVMNILTVRPFVELESLRNVFVLQIIQSKEVDSLQLNLLGN